MAERDFLKNEVLKSLSGRLESYDFKLMKTACEFVQRTNYGWNKYQIVFLSRDKGWELKPCLLIRFNVVEDLYHQISDFEKKYQKVTPTLGTSIEDLDINELGGRFNLFEESQINIIVGNLFQLFKSIALPFFSQYNTIEAVDNQINKNIEDTSLTGGIFKGLKGLIIAKLLDRKDFEILETKYYIYYSTFSDGFYLLEYERLRKYLLDNA